MSMHNDNEIAAVRSDVLGAASRGSITVGFLEKCLLQAFPAADACEWDHTGLLVGDALKDITGVGICLDPTLGAIAQAKELGDNVIVSHHPVFLDPPEVFQPPGIEPYGSGTVVWEAISSGVALMNFHTSLDVNPAAARILPQLFNLNYLGILDPFINETEKGFGQLCKVRDNDKPLTLEQLAARATSVFGSFPRVWGDPASYITNIVTCTGSAGDLPAKALNANTDCLICGEIKYHAALEASQAGLCIIELGHDVSEIPLCAPLAQAVVDAGVAKEAVHLLDNKTRWWTPDSSRR